MTFREYRGDDAAELAGRAVARGSAAAIGVRGAAVVGVPGGRSVAKVFSQLAVEPLAWDRVELFPADERCVPLDSEESNYTMLESALLRRIKRGGRTGEPHFHPYVDDPRDRAASLARFNARFHAVVPQARFDVLLLGVGEDGHIASLFPKSDTLNSEERGYLPVGDSPKPPPERISVTPSLIRNARRVVLVLLGEGKRDALKMLLNPNISVAECPARLALAAPECLLFTDLK